MYPHLHAEQALLGALLLEPARIEDVREHLLPDHLYRAAHGALYRALLGPLPDAHNAETTVAARVMALVQAAGKHAAGITPAYAHTLMAACPHPRNARLYARMIVEAADHRAVARHAIRLGQVAAADTDRDGIADTLTHHRALHAALDDLARRWGEPHSAPAPGPARTAPPEPPCPRDLIEEHALVTTLMADARPLGEIARWLGPGDFADRAHAALYRCVAALVHRGDVVDSLTVLWEAQRRGHLADGSLVPELVLRIGASGVPGSTEYWAKRVLRAAVLRTATAGSHAVRGLADDRTLPILRLVSSAREVLAPLDAIHNRWNTATRPPSVGMPAGGSPAPAFLTRTAARSRTTTTTSPPPPGPVPGGPTTATTSAARRRL
ncbi:DnaB-like helicase N-terminal domain-containing protein [Embleya hyalina]|uniref:DNA helicase DnaB-like N-terminal domain-containing protein n=1 Tax=Embleya hyalina TaxID=516124 RepID=A0A401YGL6_9ACTN|nr:DnaB-like helicase N-terminal domain-containing protein [Embleya hyalina]GCD93755.1 hypothetical protein EHYA_01403 [Embleya hyalina]